METFLNILEALFFVPFLYEANQVIFRRLKEKHDFFSIRLMNRLFIYHLAFGAFYYAYASFNPSDSHKYFLWTHRMSGFWLSHIGIDTKFIDFISFPFVHWFGFSYEMMMLLFVWIGFFGFVYAYLFFRENIALKVKIFKKIDLLTLILFFPNMHFWTASLGKGAPIFLGLMLFAYSIRRPKERILGVLGASLLVFCIRPHIFLLLAIGVIAGFLFGNVSIRRKLVVCSVMLLGIFILKDQILAVVHLTNSHDLVADFLKFTTRRAHDLDDAGSGVNMAGYSLPEKIFTFWFRPLFFDAPGILGIFVSVENLLYLILFLKIFRSNFFHIFKIGACKCENEPGSFSNYFLCYDLCNVQSRHYNQAEIDGNVFSFLCNLLLSCT